MSLATKLPRRAVAVPYTLPRVQRRAYNTNQDIQITRTGKPIVSISGGRASLGGHTVTVFGATGFLGRYVVNRLARRGNTCVIPFREEMAKRHLKVAGDLGRVVFMEMDLRNKDSIEESIRHSDTVINMIGREYPTKNFTLHDTHAWGTQRIVEAVAKYDVDRYIHMSSYNADVNSPSEFYRTKGEGEQIARSIFPETTIIRPAPCFGYEDNMLQKLASGGRMLSSNNMQQRFWPVHAIDIGKAIEYMLKDDSTAGQTYELHGNTNYSLAEIAEIVDREILKSRSHINIPKALRQPLLNVLNKVLWWPVGSADEVEREFIDQVIDEEAKTFKDLGMEPDELTSLTYKYVLPYRSSAYYDLPPQTEREKREEKKYLHVIDNQ